MKKIYSFLLMLLMAAVSVNAAVTSGEGWTLNGHKLFVELPLMDWHQYSSANDVPWASVSGQIQEVHIIRGDFSLDTPDVLYINPYMFANMYSLRYVYIQLYDAKKIMICAHAFENSTLYGMSRYEGKITSVEEYAFKNCTKLESIRFNDDNDVCFVNEHAFEGCTKLVSVYGKIERVEASAFKGCTALEEINLSKALSIGNNAFSGCGQLRSVNLKECMEIGRNAFRECYLPAVTIENCTSIGDYAFYYGIQDNGDLYMNRIVPPTTLGTDVFLGVSLPTVTLHIPENATGYDVAPWTNFRSETTPSEIYAVLNGTTMTLYYDNQCSARGGTLWSLSAYYKADLMNNATKIVIDPTMSAANLTDINGWFSGFKKVTAFEGFSNLYTQNVTDMGSLFSGCIGLQTLDLNGLDMSGVEDIRYMFNGCSNLQKIYCEKDWSQMSNITNAFYLFYGCTSLVGGWGTVFDANHKELDYARPDGGAEAPGYFWRAGDTGEAPQGIEQVIANTESPKARKVMMDGQVYIIRNGKAFNALGAEVK